MITPPQCTATSVESSIPFDANVTLRKARIADAVALLDLTSDRDAILSANFPIFSSVDYWTRRIEGTGPHHEMLVAHSSQRQLVGWTELLIDINSPLRRHVGLLGLCVHRDFRGRGIGNAILHDLISYAERWQQVQRLELIVWSDNTGARRLYERNGFVVEGEMRAYGLRDGRYPRIDHGAICNPAGEAMRNGAGAENPNPRLTDQQSRGLFTSVCDGSMRGRKSARGNEMLSLRSIHAQVRTSARPDA